MVVKTVDWEDFYQTGNIGWDRGSSSFNLGYWLDNDLLKPCRILIPGCGNGYEVLTLAQLGFDVVAVDIAATPIDNLSKALEQQKLEAELVLSDFFEWHPEEKFDAIFEQTSLCALPPELWQKYENCLYNWLKPQGKLLAAFMQTGQQGGPPYHCAIDEMDDLFSSDRWEWSKEHTRLEKEPGKTEQLFMLKRLT